MVEQNANAPTIERRGMRWLVQHNLLLGGNLEARGYARRKTIFLNRVDYRVLELFQPGEVYFRSHFVLKTSGGFSRLASFHAVILVGSTWTTILFQNQLNFSRSERKLSM